MRSKQNVQSPICWSNWTMFCSKTDVRGFNFTGVYFNLIIVLSKTLCLIWSAATFSDGSHLECRLTSGKVNSVGACSPPSPCTANTWPINWDGQTFALPCMWPKVNRIEKLALHKRRTRRMVIALIVLCYFAGVTLLDAQQTSTEFIKWIFRFCCKFVDQNLHLYKPLWHCEVIFSIFFLISILRLQLTIRVVFESDQWRGRRKWHHCALTSNLSLPPTDTTVVAVVLKS